jgi:Protein of unknown function (DUF3563)
MLIHTSFPTLRFARVVSFQPADGSSADLVPPPPRLTLLQRLDRWLWTLESRGRERYLAAAADRFDLERRMRHIDRTGAFWFG